MARWGMVIDLDRCTGCQACVVACKVENNVPPTGADESRQGRAIALRSPFPGKAFSPVQKSLLEKSFPACNGAFLGSGSDFRVSHGAD